MKYEYGVAHHLIDMDGDVVFTSHREDMTEDEAKQWLREWESDMGKTGVFKLIRRLVQDWEVVE